MKVNFATTPIASFDRIRSAESGKDAPKRDSQEQPRKEDENTSDSDKGFSESVSEVLATAVDAFSHDDAVTANGLSAALEGKGPGLRVTLTDGRGAVVRQFTGEEFLRLREAATVTKRGSLLDKKF